MNNIILIHFCHQEKGEVPLASVFRHPSLNHCIINLKVYHHAVLKLENLASNASCLGHSSYQVLDMQV